MENFDKHLLEIKEVRGMSIPPEFNNTKIIEADYNEIPMSEEQLEWLNNSSFLTELLHHYLVG